MNIGLKEVHIGEAILKQLEKQKMTKTEFGRRIGVPQQHVNRIFERETIETNRLIKICHALNYNFFALFCEFPTNVSAYLAAVSLGDGDAFNSIGDAALLAQLEVMKEKVKGLEESKQGQREQIEQLKSQLQDKIEIIELNKKLQNH